MRKTYTSPKVKARWNRRHYDRFTILVKKGEREKIAEYAKSQGMSVNGLFNEIIREVLGVEEQDWKPLYVIPMEDE